MKIKKNIIYLILGINFFNCTHFYSKSKMFDSHKIINSPTEISNEYFIESNIKNKEDDQDKYFQNQLLQLDKVQLDTDRFANNNSDIQMIKNNSIEYIGRLSSLSTYKRLLMLLISLTLISGADAEGGWKCGLCWTACCLVYIGNDPGWVYEICEGACRPVCE